MSAAFIPSAQAALLPPAPSHISPITYGGHPIPSTDQADTSQRATLVVVALVGIFIIVGLLTCTFYVCLRHRIHRFCRSLPRSIRSTPPPPTKRPRSESDLRDLEKAVRQMLVTKSSPFPSPRTSLPYLNSPPLSPVEGCSTVNRRWGVLGNELSGPALSSKREDRHGEPVPPVPPSIPSSPRDSRSQSVPRMLSVYGRQVSIQTSLSPPTSPLPPVTALTAQGERSYFYTDEAPATSDLHSSPKQECQSLIPTIVFQPYSPSLDSVTSSPIEPVSPHTPLWSERLISRSSCASSLLSNARSSTGSFLVYSKIESMEDLQRAGTPSEDSETAATLPIVESEASSGWRFSSSSEVSGTTSEGIRSSQETTYPALSALMALVVGCEVETRAFSEDVHQTPQPLSPIGAGNPSTSMMSSVPSDEFVEISLSSEPAEYGSPPEVDSIPTGDQPTKKSGRQRTPESRLMSQLIDELTGGSGRWKSYDEFFGISQDDLIDADEPTPSSTPDSGTPLSANFSLPGTPTNVTFPPRVASRPIGRQPTFIGMDWNSKRTSSVINIPQRMPPARTRLSNPLSLILEVDSSESASLYSQDCLHDSSNISRSSSSSEITIRDRIITRLEDDNACPPPRSYSFPTVPSRNLIRPLVLSEKYPRPRPLTLDVTAGALSQSQSYTESIMPSVGLCSLLDTDLETRKALGTKPPPPRPILPNDLEAVYPSGQDNVENGPQGTTPGLRGMLGKLIGFGAENMDDSRNAIRCQ